MTYHSQQNLTNKQASKQTNKQTVPDNSRLTSKVKSVLLIWILLLSGDILASPKQILTTGKLLLRAATQFPFKNLGFQNPGFQTAGFQMSCIRSLHSSDHNPDDIDYRESRSCFKKYLADNDPNLVNLLSIRADQQALRQKTRLKSRNQKTFLPLNADPDRQVLLPTILAKQTIDLPVKLGPSGVIIPKPNGSGTETVGIATFVKQLELDRQYCRQKDLSEELDRDIPMIRLLCLEDYTKPSRSNVNTYHLARALRDGLNVRVMAHYGLVTIGPKDEINPISPPGMLIKVDWKIFTPLYYKRK